MSESIPWPKHGDENDNSDVWYRINAGPDEIAFLEQSTGIKDEKALKAHAFTIQEKALTSQPYSCIKRFTWLGSKIAKHPAYLEIQNRNKTSSAIFLDIGCCLGTDVRKVILDGWNPENIAGIDILPAYFQLGREFFKEPRPGSPNPIFLAGDLFSVDFLSINPSQATNVPALRKVKELSEMAGAAQVIHIASVFHLFEELQQVDLAHRLNNFLSMEPGSIIFGSQIGMRTAGTLSHRWIHSPDSWHQMWQGVCGGGVKVWSDLQQNRSGFEGTLQMRWTVERL